MVLGCKRAPGQDTHRVNETQRRASKISQASAGLANRGPGLEGTPWRTLGGYEGNFQ